MKKTNTDYKMNDKLEKFGLKFSIFANRGVPPSN